MTNPSKSGNFVSKAVAALTAVSLSLVYLPSDASAQRKFTKSAAKIAMNIPKTWVVTGTFAEVDPKTLTAITINAPQVMKFKWGTGWKDANEGVWRLKRLGPKANQSTVLATGIVSPAPGRFDIDLGQYLAPTPAQIASKYHVEVVARKKGSVDNTTATSPGKAGAKVPPKEFGFWSVPVVITYRKSTTPTTTFDFHDIYRKATLCLDKFVLVEDQYGPGGEEYHIGAFMQELFTANGNGGKFERPGRQKKLGQYYYEMNPPKARSFKFNQKGFQQVQCWDFNLDKVKQNWPRRFMLVASVMEEDDGGEIGNWKKGFNGMQKALDKGNDLYKLSESQLKKYIKEYGLDGVHYLLDVASVIASAASQSGPVAIVTTTAIIAGVYIGAIVQDMADDYYGTNAGLLTLPSNRVDEVRKLPGKVVGSGKSERYVLKQQTLTFRGPSPALAAVACCDGKVEIKFHWSFSQREQE